MSHTKKREESYLQMTNDQKALNMLGLAMRAGKLVTGEEMTIQDIRRQKSKLVFVASDASENTRKKIQDKSSHYEVTCLESFTHEELSQAIGKARMVIGINDQGFAKKIKELILG